MSTIAVRHQALLPRAVPTRPARVRGAVATPPAALRLTRRGRFVVFLGSLVVILMLGVFVGAGSVATRDAGSPPPTEVVVVGSGETLWSIASEVAAGGGADVREVMFEIERLNALDSEFLHAGQRLRVPAVG